MEGAGLRIKHPSQGVLTFNFLKQPDVCIDLIDDF